MGDLPWQNQSYVTKNLFEQNVLEYFKCIRKCITVPYCAQLIANFQDIWMIYAALHLM
jgi:hypothetical protein